MSERRHVRIGFILAVAGAACLSAVAPAWAAAPPADPPGANGTVKIDGREFDPHIDNEPHVTCDFHVNFFNFDQDERANIVFTAQPPTGSGTELLRRDNVLVSDDAATGGAPDPDEVFAFSASGLGLDGFTPHPKQGFHVKLTVERIGAPGAGKHKVFWVQPCPSSKSPTPSGSQPTSTSPSAGGAGAGGGEAGGALPITGASVTGLAALGGSLVAGGAALLFLRRRRDNTSTE